SPSPCARGFWHSSWPPLSDPRPLAGCLSASRLPGWRLSRCRTHRTRMPDATALPGNDAPPAGRCDPGSGRRFAPRGMEISNALEGATVLVTGGAGLIGSHIVDRMVEEGAGEIRVLDNLVRGCRDNLAPAVARRPIRFFEADVRDRLGVQLAVTGCDYVF